MIDDILYTFRLSLQDSQSNLLLQLSFRSDDKDSVFSADEDFVDFTKFQESFVAVLSATADQLIDPSESDDDKNSVVMEPSVAYGEYLERKNENTVSE